MPDYQSISPTELHENQKNSEVDLVDVRTPVEFQEVHALNARNVSLDKLDPRKLMESRNGQSDQPVYVICQSGNRSTKACEKIVAAGFENVVNVNGGTKAWVEAGLPVVRGKKAISLERQVRIVAGSISFIGAILALFVSVYFAVIPAFIGAGLTFAGITDTCGMGMILAKMPWNQVRQDNGAECSVS